MSAITELEEILAEYNPWWKTGQTYGDFTLVDIQETDTSRWSRWEQYVVQHIDTGNFYAFDVESGLTELQEVDQDDYNVREVVKNVKLVEMTFWNDVKVSA